MKSSLLWFIIALLFVVSCSKKIDPVSLSNSDKMYFPETTGSSWETQTIASLGWNQSAVQPLKDYLVQNNSKSFMFLVKGRIMMEEYFNNHTTTTTWPWNSAGKTLTTAITGIAQQEELLNINTKVSDYLGNGWTTAPLVKEQLITSKHLLTMTSGLSDANNFVTPTNLSYLSDAGTRWSYHNVFQRLMDVVAKASNQNISQ